MLNFKKNSFLIFLMILGLFLVLAMFIPALGLNKQWDGNFKEFLVLFMGLVFLLSPLFFWKLDTIKELSSKKTSERTKKEDLNKTVINEPEKNIKRVEIEKDIEVE